MISQRNIEKLFFANYILKMYLRILLRVQIYIFPENYFFALFRYLCIRFMLRTGTNFKIDNLDEAVCSDIKFSTVVYDGLYAVLNRHLCDLHRSASGS